MPVKQSNGPAPKSQKALYVEALQREYDGLKAVGHPRAEQVMDELRRVGATAITEQPKVEGLQGEPVKAKPKRQRATSKKAKASAKRKRG